ncbi:MAG: ParB/RepB/Spo0J family partition protein [Acidobacteriota bacterium]
MNPKNALGRGLDALIGPSGPEPRRVLEVEVHRLRPNPRQPRVHFEEGALEELARSIEANGLLQPILVRPAGGEYEIIAGERRWRAAQKAGLQRVPVLVKEAVDEEMVELALVENLQRADLNPVEEARAYKLLIEELGLKQEEVARKVGKERATVANALRLLNLGETALRALEEGVISVGHAKAVLAQRRREDQEALLSLILSKGLSVREAEAYRKGAKESAKKRPKPDADTLEAAAKLTRLLGFSVEIRRRGKGGEVAVKFRDEGELQTLFDWFHADLRRTG